MEDLWQKTQSPALHEQWDLRFTRIEYLPRVDESQPQRFLYETRIGFGIAVRGEGESVGGRDATDGSRTSALKFWSDDPKSLIARGAGYWKYIPTDNGIRFFTGYDYSTRFGAIGKALDAVVFRPLIGWATALSFDRLRLWIEKGIDPAVSLQRAWLHAVSFVVIAFVWIYHGAVPKLLARNTDELQMVLNAGISAAAAPVTVQVAGLAEILMGLFVCLFRKKRFPYLLTIALMVLATAGAILNSPRYISAAFNPISLNALMIAISLVGLTSLRDIPSASNCLRKPPADAP
jgi:hypothetical protein